MIRKVLFLGAACLLFGASAAFAFPPIDLTVAGAVVTGDGGVVFQQLQDAPTGTGVFNPFLRFQAGDVEEGMNTDGNAHDTYDDVASLHTHAFTLGELQSVTNPDGIPAGTYYFFSLDINEENNDANRYLSLDEIRIYTLAGSATLTSEAAVLGAGGILRYDLDAISDQDVYMDHQLTEGSGHDDMAIWIPTSYFAGAAAGDQVYFYNKAGDTGGAYGADFASGDGFEEWHALFGPNTIPIPEPSTVMLLGTGLLGLAAVRRRR
jgi:hypothetical protein